MEAILGTPIARCAECDLPIAPDGTCLLKDYGYGTFLGSIDYLVPSDDSASESVGFKGSMRSAHLRRSFMLYPRDDPKSKR